MANFPRQAPSGFAIDDELPSAAATNWDIFISKAVNGDDGSTHDGDVTLGSLALNRDLAVAGSVTVDVGVTVTEDVAADAFVGGSSQVDIALADKVQPKTISTQTLVGTSSANDSATLDLRAHDTFVIKIGSETSSQYTFGNLTLTTAGGSAIEEVKSGATFRIFFEVNATSASTAAVERRADATWPASMVFTSDSDKLLMLDSPLDGVLYELTQIGTPGTPKFAVRVTRYRK